MSELMVDESRYIVGLTCDNCGRKSEKLMEKGKRRPDVFKCPHCYCESQT